MADAMLLAVTRRTTEETPRPGRKEPNMFKGHDVKRYVDEVIATIDSGRTPVRPSSPWWVRQVAVPVALGVSVGLVACNEEEAAPDITKAEAIEAKADGFTDDLCDLLGEAPGCDLCDAAGWYGDGVCDDFCDEPDSVDCSATARYMAPMAETVCDDGADDDGDGLVDCDDDDCADDLACQPAARYMAPMAETACDDGADDDGDGLVDCDDDDCADDLACQPAARYMAPMA
jgi:hypothetical protein